MLVVDRQIEAQFARRRNDGIRVGIVPGLAAVVRPGLDGSGRKQENLLRRITVRRKLDRGRRAFEFVVHAGDHAPEWRAASGEHATPNAECSAEIHLDGTHDAGPKAEMRQLTDAG